jgi:hypothetical protein
MRKLILLLITLLLGYSVRSQNIAIGQWEEHLNYKKGLSVAEGNGKVYCATKSGIFILNKADYSMDRLSKVNGLSDVEATVLNFNTYNNKLIIAYKNSNLDIIENGGITNIGDIKRKPIIGNKSINNIYFINQFAYLSCGFGIVVIDMDRNEVKDTYYLGPNGNPINVRDVTVDGTYIYAATDAGIYKALQNNPFLADYASWVKMPGLPIGTYNTISTFNGNIFTNFSKYDMSGVNNQDTVFSYNIASDTWSKFGTTNNVVVSIRATNNKLLILSGSVAIYDINLSPTGLYIGHSGDSKQGVIDNSNNLWIADGTNGLVLLNSNGYRNQYPNGPTSENISAMSLEGGNLWIAPGRVDSGWHNQYDQDGLSYYSNGDWINTKRNYPPVVNFDGPVYDILNVLVDPKNPKRTYAATWWTGVYELYDGIPIKHYDDSTSSLRRNSPGGPIWTYGLALDAANNLWVTNSLTPFCVSTKNVNGTWTPLNFSFIAGNGSYVSQILIDKHDQKWIILSSGGIMVYNGGANNTPNTTNTKKMTTVAGSGALPSTNVFCLAEDMDGEIWVGTDKGIAVFYTPENVFSGQNYDAQQILLEQDGHVQILLETEQIQSIAIDDANRKWIATANSGVFLMSADGTKQIQHFDIDNSPLLSNNVKSVVINHETGEVYFGTSKGLISFRGTATIGLEDYTDVYAFPNPVKHEYNGPIAIKGLVSNSTIKITDVSGTLVYQTKSEGGQAIWYGKNFKDERVSSGVYFVFCSDEEGSKKMVTKILVIN